MLASEIFLRASTLFLDETNVRWTLPELCMWLNDAQREIVLQKPSASSINRVIELQAGTYQKIPEDALSLLRIVRNISSVGLNDQRVGGAAIRIVSRDILDGQQRDWHSGTEVPFATIVKHYVYDEEDQRSFYVYPGNSGNGRVEAVLSIVPAAIEIDEGDNPAERASYDKPIALPDIYASAIVDFVCYRAYAKDAEYAGNAQRAALHYQQFANSLGIKFNQELLNSPNRGPGIKAMPSGAT